MTKGNYFGYERISTKEERGLQKFTRQDAALNRYAEENNIEFVYIAKEDISGKTFDDRKEWQKLEKLIKAGDTIIFKDISRFIRDVESGYKKYMELLNNGIELIFIDNAIVSTPYIKELLRVAEEQDIIARTTLESTVKLLIIVELDRVAKERTILVKRIKDGIAASDKKSGRPEGSLAKMSEELEQDIKEFLTNRSIKQIDLMNKYNISRNTLKKYISIVEEKQAAAEAK